VAARFDVAARLMEGVEAVDEIQTYVEACRLRGYQHADLTATRIRDWYTAEEGLDLRVLDADCATLRGIAGDAGEALRSARSLAVALADAWTGQGGAVAAEFVRRHCNTAEILVEALRVAADVCAVLRDELWQVADRRVAQTQEIVDRARAQRPVWLAAAHAVLAGGQVDDDAVRTVDGQLKPFVDNAIGVEWVSAMRLADGDATAAFRAAIDGAGAGARLRFEVPGDLGPRTSAPQAAMQGAEAVAPPVGASRHVVSPGARSPTGNDWPAMPTDLLAPSVPPVIGPAPSPAVPSPNASDTLAALPPLYPGTGLPGLGTAGVPGLGGASAAPNLLADTLGGLLGGRHGDELSDPPDLPDRDQSEHSGELAEIDDKAYESHVPEGQPDESTSDTSTADGSDDPPTDPANADCDEAPPEPLPAGRPADDAASDAEPPETKEPVAAPPPPTAEGSPTAEVPDTPCAIAADELPHAGE
jgi:hypothetical protein